MVGRYVTDCPGGLPRVKLEIKVNASYHLYYSYTQTGWRTCGNSTYTGALEKKPSIFVLASLANFTLVKTFSGASKEVGATAHK